MIKPNNPRAAALFNDVYHGAKNFMTPHVIAYRMVGKYAVEISKGEGIDGSDAFGLTVLSADGQRFHKLSGYHSSLESVEEAIAMLRKGRTASHAQELLESEEA